MRSPRRSRTATHAAIGQTVKALDRHNIGTIIGLDDTAGEVLVGFLSADGKCAERSLAWQEVEILDAHATPRSLPDTARTRLAQLTHAADATLATWTSYLADNGVEPGEADNVQQAIRRVIERATNTLIADQPQWLTTLVGYQPADPIGTQTWTTAVRDIATWRTRHHHTGDDVGILPVLDDAARQAWEALSTRLVHTKAWLDHRDPPTVLWPHRRSHHELVARRTELDQIFETAPADQQPLIARLRRGDPQLLDDTAEVLKAALDNQHARRHWILEHWPHIVEYAEITNTLTTPTLGPRHGHHPQQPCAGDWVRARRSGCSGRAVAANRSRRARAAMGHRARTRRSGSTPCHRGLPPTLERDQHPTPRRNPSYPGPARRTRTPTTAAHPHTRNASRPCQHESQQRTGSAVSGGSALRLLV